MEPASASANASASAAALWKCYLLATSDGAKPSKTYVGVTPDLDRRLQQHNGVQAGGAFATRGRAWSRICAVHGFPDHRAALQFEWRWKQLTRRLPAGEPVARRLRALQQLLTLDRPTTAAVPYSEWSQPPDVRFEPGVTMPAL